MTGQTKRAVVCAMVMAGLALTSACCNDGEGNGGGAPPEKNPVRERYDIRVGEASLTVELALTPEERTMGFMHRRDIPEGAGMLFVFPEARPLSFWMKNTHVPLSIAFIDSDGRVFQIEDMPPHSRQNVVSREPARYALEVPQGWFDKADIAPGDRLILPQAIRYEIEDRLY